ncbi:hypothetical protein NSQ95_09020 [Psychrobacillus sp. FSL W7-1457]|uniref:hypothetical protein n=1 Tax=Psychrobacillus sp. FSL W7-1457 TaxID=2954547 RepID=UPI00315A3B11
MVNLIESVNEVTILLLWLCGYAYIRLLKKTKRERKLNRFEVMMYIITYLVTFLYAASYVLLTFGT